MSISVFHGLASKVYLRISGVDRLLSGIFFTTPGLFFKNRMLASVVSGIKTVQLGPLRLIGWAHLASLEVPRLVPVTQIPTDKRAITEGEVAMVDLPWFVCTVMVSRISPSDSGSPQGSH
jgi:hypothetical protein